MKKLFVVLVAIAMIASLATAQLKQGAFGIQTGVLGGEDLFNNIGGKTLGVLYNVNQNTRVGFGIGFATVSPSVGSSTSDFQIGAGFDYYLNSADNLSTLVGAQIGYLTYSPGSGTSMNGVDIQAKVGAEYAFSSRFSIQAFIGLEYFNIGPNGAKYSVIRTLSGTALTFYF
ncbi:MAG: hypothetical protein NTX44_02650 [Ignavibacteriales bacterium]|nr:hypothetical protein [Ignavibacteriales bacterium]